MAYVPFLLFIETCSTLTVFNLIVILGIYIHIFTSNVSVSIDRELVWIVFYY